MQTKELDLVFLMDCTGSMSSYIHAAQQSIVKICENVVASEKADIRFGLVAYRDHPPQDNTYITQTFSFTSTYSDMRNHVSGLSAMGGGDGPEAVTAGLYEVLHMDWRKNSTKICILIADAPPHGLGESGDGFPNGDPQGRDPLKIAKELVANGVTVYVAGCEPALGHYTYARDFYQALARITEGQFLPLTHAGILAEVIVGGAREEMQLEQLMEQLRTDVEEARAVDPGRFADDDAVVQEMTSLWQQKGVQTVHVSVDNPYESSNYDTHNIDRMCAVESLSAAKSAFKPQTQARVHSSFGSTPSAPSGGAPPVQSFAYGAPPMRGYGPPSGMLYSSPSSSPSPQQAQQANLETASISHAHVSKMWNRSKMRHS